MYVRFKRQFAGMRGLKRLYCRQIVCVSVCCGRSSETLTASERLICGKYQISRSDSGRQRSARGEKV